MTEIAVFWTIAAATLAWAVAEGLRLLQRQLRLARVVWTAGACLMLIHAVAAFLLLYGASQATALTETARQTAALTGVDSGIGLYVNYAFLAIWMADSAWWWTVPAGRAGRPGRLGWMRFAFFTFMVVNGAVVFADGWMRRLGMVAVAAVAAAALARWRER